MRRINKEEPFYNGLVSDEEENARFHEHAVRLVEEYYEQDDISFSLACPETDHIRLVALKDTLQFFSICPKAYSLLGKHQEASICLDLIGECWTVYGFERGQKRFLQPYELFDHAVLDFLKALAKTCEDKDRMYYYYLKISNVMFDIAFENKFNNNRFLKKTQHECVLGHKVRMAWDDEAGVWVATSEEVPGLLLEDKDLNILKSRIHAAIQELLDLNGHE